MKKSNLKFERSSHYTRTPDGGTRKIYYYLLHVDNLYVGNIPFYSEISSPEPSFVELFPGWHPFLLKHKFDFDTVYIVPLILFLREHFDAWSIYVKKIKRLSYQELHAETDLFKVTIGFSTFQDVIRFKLIWSPA